MQKKMSEKHYSRSRITSFYMRHFPALIGQAIFLRTIFSILLVDYNFQTARIRHNILGKRIFRKYSVDNHNLNQKKSADSGTSNSA